MSAELQSILEVATEAALAAGSILREYCGKLESVEEKGRAGISSLLLIKRPKPRFSI
jgi:hypothetical protein